MQLSVGKMTDNKIVVINIRIAKDVKKRLDKMALTERRSITNMLQVVIEEAIEAHEANSK